MKFHEITRLLQAWNPAYVFVIHRPECHLTGWLVIDSVGEGPSFGGIRWLQYNNPKEALIDALRLSRAMTRKLLFARLPVGGSKMVLMKDSQQEKAELFKTVGEYIEGLRGLYYAGPDMGIGDEELEILQSTTQYIGCCQVRGRSLGEWTAQGVRMALSATLSFLKGREVQDWSPFSFLVQGLGEVGWEVAQTIHEKGGKLFVCDLVEEKMKKAEHVFGASPVAVHEMFACSVDVFVPCARGGVITFENVVALPWKVICGPANCVLESDELADLLHKRGILYVPDFAVSVGAVLSGYLRFAGKEDYIENEIAHIGSRVRQLLEKAYREHESPFRAAIELIERQKSFEHRPISSRGCRSN